MALHDWDVVGQQGEWVAFRRINGREISVKAGAYGTLSVSVAIREAQEQQRMQAGLIELGQLVDQALDRIKARQRQ